MFQRHFLDLRYLRAGETKKKFPFKKEIINLARVDTDQNYSNLAIDDGLDVYEWEWPWVKIKSCSNLEEGGTGGRVKSGKNHMEN